MDKNFETHMCPKEFRRVRLKHNLTLYEWGIVLGYKKSENTRNQMHNMERGLKPIRSTTAKLVQAIDAGFRTHDWPTNKLP